MKEDPRETVSRMNRGWIEGPREKKEDWVASNNIETEGKEIKISEDKILLKFLVGQQEKATGVK
jgi:hypothetical protein